MAIQIINNGETGLIVRNKLNANFAEVDVTTFSDLGSVTGTVNLDLATGAVFKATVTGDITLNFTNEEPGKEYAISFSGTTNQTLSWTASKFKFSYGNQFTFTPADSNSPASFEDIFVFKCFEPGVLHVSFLPDMKLNS